MRFSLFTPTHNPQFIKRLEQSIQNQTYKDFEWIVVPNGSVDCSDLSLTDAKIISYRGETLKIGEIKSFCCSHAKGEILVEVDHDDELTPDALSLLDQAFSPEVDFVFSNCVEIKNDKPHVYNPKFGWKYRPFKYNDKLQAEAIAFPPSPASFSKIWYAPNHVRAWRASFYQKIGGHNKDLAILDDHDLLCRTYIHGTVKHLDKAIYIYHIHDQNTCYGEQNQFIQEETLNIHDKYIYPLVEKWCDICGLRKIDLGGGFNCPPGYESVDLKNASITCDLNEKWPFEDNTIGVFRAHDIIEHLKDPIHVMQEAHRCLSPGGWFLILVPSTDGRGAFQDPTHISYWNSNSFWYYTKNDLAKFIGMPVRFQLNRIKNYFPNDWCKTHNIVYTKADLVKVSEERMPGLVEI